MNLKDYQEESRKTYRAIAPCSEEIYEIGVEYPVDDLIYPAMLLLEEAGELAGKISKAMRDNHGIIDENRREAIKAEAGDVAWAWMQLCINLDLDPEDVLQANIDKLRSRQARGVLGGSGDER